MRTGTPSYLFLQKFVAAMKLEQNSVLRGRQSRPGLRGWVWMGSGRDFGVMGEEGPWDRVRSAGEAARGGD
ncbi:unnamed protein product [Sphenostylis stenocarpa]|uniref:Uncharacterized protein n=1 Tax=Sphenostylis stenocarpa TaxID=92480 RepID=A0AA86SBH0_9FABA|nr:unnamed protein product [Sphenostylis stenocarpa]